MPDRSKRFIFFVRIPLFFACMALCAVAVFSKRGVLDWRRMVHDNGVISKQLAAGYLERDRLQRRIEALETSHDEQERVVRQMLGFVKPNEIVMEFD